jgi:ribosome maturation factor RimP
MRDTSDSDRRYVRESPLESRIAAIAAPVAAALGYRLVRVRVTPRDGCTVQIMAEDADGAFTIDDCEALSRDLSPALDVEDPIGRPYRLEISSPGIDRPLVRLADFERFAGHEAKIETFELIAGRRRFRGFLEPVAGADIRIRLNDAPAGADPVAVIPAAAIAEAKLVLTDDLIAKAKAGAAARTDAAPGDGSERQVSADA